MKDESVLQKVNTSVSLKVCYNLKLLHYILFGRSIMCNFNRFCVVKMSDWLTLCLSQQMAHHMCDIQRLEIFVRHFGLIEERQASLS